MFSRLWQWVSQRLRLARSHGPSLKHGASAPVSNPDYAALVDILARNAEYLPDNAAIAGLDMAPAYLRAMAEPSLVQYHDGYSECYRFLWMRSFQPTVMVRVDSKAEQHKLVAKSWEGMPLPAMGRSGHDTSRALTAEESKSFRDLLKQVRFWKLETQSTRQGLDGAYWVLEGRSASEHRVVVRWSPDADGPDRAFRELCAFMLHIGGIELTSAA